MRKPANSSTARNTSSNHLSCKRLMRLLLAANNQATRRNEIIKSYLQLGSSSNRYAPPLAPNKKTKSSTKQLPPTDPILVRKTFSKPASLKRAPLVALPAAISHKASLKPKRCASATLIQQTSKNEPGPSAPLSKKQKKSSFTVSFLGTVWRYQNETAKSQNQQQRPTRATNKNDNCV